MLKMCGWPWRRRRSGPRVIMKRTRIATGSWISMGLSDPLLHGSEVPPSFCVGGVREAEYSRILRSTLEMEELVTKQSAVMDKYDPEKKVADGGG